MFEDIVKERPIVIDKSRKEDKVPKTPVLGPVGSGSNTIRGTSTMNKVILHGLNGDEFIRITQNDDVYAYGSIELRRGVILDAFYDWLVDMGYDD